MPLVSILFPERIDAIFVSKAIGSTTLTDAFGRLMISQQSPTTPCDGVPSLAKPFFEYFDTGKWVDAKGQPVRNWKQKFLTWESKEREKGTPSQPGKKPGYNVQHHGDELSDVQRAAIRQMMEGGA